MFHFIFVGIEILPKRNLHVYHPQFFRKGFGLIFVIFYSMKSYPCNYLSRECGLYEISDLLFGHHIREKSDEEHGDLTFHYCVH